MDGGYHQPLMNHFYGRMMVMAQSVSILRQVKLGIFSMKNWGKGAYTKEGIPQSGYGLVVLRPFINLGLTVILVEHYKHLSISIHGTSTSVPDNRMGHPRGV